MIFWCVFWAADPFATKLDLMAHHHKLDCLVKRLDCPVVVKVKVTKSSKFQWMFIRTISPQLIKFGIMVALSWSSVSCITFKVIVRAHIIKYECFYHICWTADFFATTFNRMVPDQAGVFCAKIRFLFSRSRSQWKFCTTDLLATKLGVLMYY